MKNESIQYFNRYRQRVEEEAVFKEHWLRWAYESVLGRMTLWAILKRSWFSRWYGMRMRSKASRSEIEPFIKRYQLDASEWDKKVHSFTSFNDFFSRRLKPGARPVSEDPSHAVFPADGRHWGCQNVRDSDHFFVKGQRFNLVKLLGHKERAAPYMNGTLVFSRLCPTDYHRFHFPDGGVVRDTKKINGTLSSVSPIALRRHMSILWENRRTFTRIKSDHFGMIGLVEVGATFVGSIVQTCAPGSVVNKGDEKGFFQFGGSAFITLFEPGRIRLSEDLLECSAKGMELYARMGDVMGTRI